MSSICRLCLKPSSDTYKDLRNVDRKYFDLVLPEIDLITVTSPVLCESCVKSLRTAYLFKFNCLETERIIKTYLEKRIVTGEVAGINLDDVLRKELVDVHMKHVEVKTENNSEHFNNGFESVGVCNDGFDSKTSFAKHNYSGDLECNICSKTFSTTRNIKRHMVIHDKKEETTKKVEPLKEEIRREMESLVKKHDKTYKDEYNCTLLCEICRDLFENKEKLLEHVRSHFGVKCQQCEIYFKDSISLECHTNEHKVENMRRSGRIYSCDVCGKSYITRSLLVLHLRSHFERPRCKLCGNKEFKNTKDVKEHMLGAHNITINFSKFSDSKEYDNVDFDVDIIKMRDAVNKHLQKYCDRRKLDSDVIVCNICSKTFISETVLDDHMKSHFCRPMCTICNKGYYNSHSLMRHMSKFHNIDIPTQDLTELKSTCENTLQCNVCGKVMATRSSFIRHGMTHSNDKPHTCEYCQKRFLMKYYLQKHVNTVHLRIPRDHTSSQVFICHTCGYRTYHKYNFTLHVHTHTGQKPFKCDICNKGFAQKTTVALHKRMVHARERLFTCEYCSKSFGIRGTLKKHILDVHMADKVEKKFVCSYCGKKYRTQCQLTDHLKWHVGDRKFGCDLCGKLFISRHSVKKHRVTHFSEKQHKCEICGKGFHQKSNIKIHMRVHSKV